MGIEHVWRAPTEAFQGVFYVGTAVIINGVTPVPGSPNRAGIGQQSRLVERQGRIPGLYTHTVQRACYVHPDASMAGLI